MNARALLPAILLLAPALPAGAQDTPASVARLDHVAIFVADQQKSIEFYRDLFGLSEIPAPFPAGGPRWMRFANGIELHIQPGRTEPVAQHRRVHMAVAVASLDLVMAKLKARGQGWSDVAGTPGAIQTLRTDGIRQIFFQDPDGYWIEVNDTLKKR
ncbi:lactoylglutathione lyase [Sphingomonas naasensis]|uniref:VOC family protein n=1 Tax=Sphingomonas naasensis TaxID=1344951 RepID=A0A4S1WS08_9SPHN|nr:VOC family protein [Sphingomonas naasensis]NIJ18979.1 lactoylglutathione lyase [Sphingomonas naasensis]TGX46189.1 VOC family protein [Sphingomonas naasensis]